MAIGLHHTVLVAATTWHPVCLPYFRSRRFSRKSGFPSLNLTQTELDHRTLSQDAQTELLKGWHLDDQPTSDQQQPGVKTMAAAVSAAASRVFGRDGADAGGSAAAGDGASPRQRGATRPPPPPHLVHTPGADGGGGRPAAAATAAAAAALTSASGALGDLAERAVDAPVRGLRELNRAVTAGVSDFLASDSGRRLSEQMAAEMSTGALMAPVYLTEELVKARLKSLLRNHACWLATFLAVRVSVATALLHCTKGLLRRSVRKRGPRWLRGCVHFLCDVMLPTGFFGPLLGITFGALQLTGVSVGGLLLHRIGGGAGGASATGTSSGAGGAGGGGGRRVAGAAQLPILVAPLPFPLLLLPQPTRKPQQQQQHQGQHGCVAGGERSGGVVGGVTGSAAAAVAGLVGDAVYAFEVWS
ncbi:hypothetical protein PLESTF_001708600 [Pleodorina starrii]|nr:hypothetical protein PLESTF_001708600 [Pleodorina starrii]